VVVPAPGRPCVRRGCTCGHAAERHPAGGRQHGGHAAGAAHRADPGGAGRALRRQIPTRAVCTEYVALRKEGVALLNLQKKVQWKAHEVALLKDGHSAAASAEAASAGAPCGGGGREGGAGAGGCGCTATQQPWMWTNRRRTHEHCPQALQGGWAFTGVAVQAMT